MHYTGHERDMMFGERNSLDYMHARHYDAIPGRFLSIDPLGGNRFLPQSWNKYAYVLNNSVGYVDPFGLSWWDSGSRTYYDAIDAICPSCGVFFGWSGQGNDSKTRAGHRDMQGQGSDKGTIPCVGGSSLNLFQQAQFAAARLYAGVTGLTIGFGAGFDAGGGLGPSGSAWNVGAGGSGSTLIVADRSGNGGFLNSGSGGLSGVKMGSAGSWWGGGVAAGPSVLFSASSIGKIAGPSWSISAGGGSGVFGGGGAVTSSGAMTLTAGWGAGAELGFSPQFGSSQFIPICGN